MSDRPDDELTWTKRGWPRPIVGGWPIPWVSPVEELKRTHPDRMNEVVDRAICQVCGETHYPDDYVYFFVNLENGPEPDDWTDKVVEEMDQGILHERCMKLATGRCPALRSLQAEGKLVMYRARWSSVMVYEVDEEHRKDPDDDHFKLGVAGELVERCLL